MKRSGATLCALCLLSTSLGCSDGQETSATVAQRVVEPTSQPDPSQTPTEKVAQVVTIRTNTQATIGDLRIGAGNIWEDTYETKVGGTATGLGAGVSVFVRNDKSQNVRARVHTGDMLTVAGRQIEVRSITEDSVVLAIAPDLLTGSDESKEHQPDRETPEVDDREPQVAEARESIGIATMREDGTIILRLRAVGPGIVGDGSMEYPRWHERYEYVLDHLGGLQPGEEKPVPPFRDP